MRFTLVNGNQNENFSFDGSYSYDDEESLQQCPAFQHDSSDVLTIEGLRRQYNSCSDCGVCWYDDHVNLDCSQCGGYAMCRPCPQCNGQCGNSWRRDVTASHLARKAEWVGTCASEFQWKSSKTMDSTSYSEDKNANLEGQHSCHNQNIHMPPKHKKISHGAHVL